MIAKRPAAIARCETSDDVSASIAFARQHDLDIAVRAGGHSVAGHSLCDGGLVIDVRPMKAIVIDPARKTARVGAGVTWGEFDAAAQEHGLATTGGRVSTTGVAGFTLGGGSGWIERSFGLACDNLTSVDLVTANGEAVTANESQHTDLFWALHGGGGNFGVATSFEFRLHDLGPIVLAGLITGTTRRRDVALARPESAGFSRKCCANRAMSPSRAGEPSEERNALSQVNRRGTAFLPHISRGFGWWPPGSGHWLSRSARPRAAAERGPQRSKQLRLARKREGINLVEKRVPPPLEPPAPSGRLARRYKPAGVPEELVLHQLFRESGAIHGNEREIPAPAEMVDGPGFLARPRFPADENGAVARGDARMFRSTGGNRDLLQSGSITRDLY